MKTDDKYYFWNKGEIYKFNKYFSTNEFSCRCKFETCKEQKISKEMIECLTKLREDVNEPLTVTSGFRCSEYQQHLRKSGANTVVYRDWETDRKSTRLNSSHSAKSRMPSSA